MSNVSPLPPGQQAPETWIFTVTRPRVVSAIGTPGQRISLPELFHCRPGVEYSATIAIKGRKTIASITAAKGQTHGAE